MKTMQPKSNQKGFFAVGLGIALLAAFGVIGVATDKIAGDENRNAQLEQEYDTPEQQVVAQSN